MRKPRKQPGSSKKCFPWQTPTLGGRACAPRAPKNTARRWRNWHATSMPHRSRRKLCSCWCGVCNSEAATRCPGGSYAVPKYARRTSGSTTELEDGGWVGCQPPQHEEATRVLDRGGIAASPTAMELRMPLLALPSRSTPGGGPRRPSPTAMPSRLKADCSIAHFGLGSALGEQGQPEDAIAACRRAIELKPDYARAHYGLGRPLLFRGGRLDEAVAALRKAIALEPDHAESHCNLGLAALEARGARPGCDPAWSGHELGSRQDWHLSVWPSGCENAAGSSSSVASCEKALTRDTDLTLPARRGRACVRGPRRQRCSQSRWGARPIRLRRTNLLPHPLLIFGYSRFSFVRPGCQTYFQVISDIPDSSHSSSRPLNCWRTRESISGQPLKRRR